jgi:carboxylesterase type B
MLSFLALLAFTSRSSFAWALSSLPFPNVHLNSTIATYVGLQVSPSIEEYLGIRYAHTPVGALRFARPVPLTSRGLIDATQYGAGCPQDHQSALKNGFSEDCLFVNVVRPSSLESGHPPLPVFFWIHGGNNNAGQGMLYNGHALVEKSIELGMPVVFVSCNYRLGGFGFLASEELLRLGSVNLGLHDQLAALKWVHDQIRVFGGDPKRVTIFGESAGAADAWAHIVRCYKGPEPLFSGAIMLSGAPGAVYPHGLKTYSHRHANSADSAQLMT